MHPPRITWFRLARIAGFALLVFAACNGLFALASAALWNSGAPLLDRLGALSLYGLVFPYRERLPISAAPEAFTLTVTNIPALLASHAVSRPKAADEYRVLVFGDSAVWGWLMPRDASVPAQLNALAAAEAARTPDGRRIVFYNLAYLRASISGQLALFDAAAACCQPDAVLAFITPQAVFAPYDAGGLLLPANAQRMARLAASTGVDLPSSTPPAFSPWEHTLVGQRGPLADLLRLQTSGAAWAATGIDQNPAPYTRTADDLSAEADWDGYAEAGFAWEANLRTDIMGALAGAAETAGARLAFVVQPTFIADGANADVRYNVWYPRWAADGVRERLARHAAVQGWPLLDLFAVVPADRFTDSPAHFDAEGARQTAEAVWAWAGAPLGLRGTPP